MSDDDKTLIQQAPPRGDSTVVRPMPGGRPQPGGQPAGSPPPYQQPQQAQRPAADPYLNRPVQNIQIHTGDNGLVNAASTLLAVLVKLRNTVSHENVSSLYSQMVHEIKQFEHRVKQEGQRGEIALAARYCICSALDEAVLNTPWGAHSNWGQKTLLSTFHNETSGGEKFFLILDRMLNEPSQNLDMLELLYYLLSFGFEGKYKIADRGKDKIDDIRDNLYRRIKEYRGDYERELSPSWEGIGGRNSSLINYIPIWVIAACVGALMLLTYSGFRVWLHHDSEPVYQELRTIGQLGLEESPTATDDKTKL